MIVSIINCSILSHSENSHDIYIWFLCVRMWTHVKHMFSTRDNICFTWEPWCHMSFTCFMHVETYGVTVYTCETHVFHMWQRYLPFEPWRRMSFTCISHVEKYEITVFTCEHMGKHVILVFFMNDLIRT